jgi:hypothetical protein
LSDASGDGDAKHTTYYLEVEVSFGNRPRIYKKAWWELATPSYIVD